MTIYFASIKERANLHGRVINIATGTNGGMAGLERLDCLVPGWDLVMGHKQGRLSDEQYTKGYAALIRSREAEVRAWFESLTAEEDVTFVCYCTEFQAGTQRPKFCHRHLVAKWLRKWRPDLEIVEH